MLAHASGGAPHPHRLTQAYQKDAPDTHQHDVWLSNDPGQNMATEHIPTPLDAVESDTKFTRGNWQGEIRKRGENLRGYERIREIAGEGRVLSSMSCGSLRSPSDETFASNLHEDEHEKCTILVGERLAESDPLHLSQTQSNPDGRMHATRRTHLSKLSSRTHDLECSASDTELHRADLERRHTVSQPVVGNARVGRVNSGNLQRTPAMGRQPLSKKSRAPTVSALGESRGCGSPASARSRASDVDYDWMGNTDDLLLAYVGAGNVTGVALALEKGANADATDAMGEPVVHLVVRQQNHDMWNLLKCHTANVNATDLYGATALHVAAGLPDSHLLNEIIDFGGQVDIQDRFGRTALHLAVSRNLLDNVVILLNHGADPNQKTKEGRTPLHLAALHSFADIAQALIQHGASSIEKDVEGHRPGDLAPTPTFMSDAIRSVGRAEDGSQSMPCQDTLNHLVGRVEELESTCHEHERKINEMALRSSLLSSQVVHAMMEAEKAHNLAFGAVVVSATITTIAVVMRILKL